MRSKYVIWFLFAGLILSETDILSGFGMRGPYTHERITQEAFELFSKRTGFEVRYDCAELINQTNTQADVFYPLKPEFHCDNSEFFKCSLQLEKLKGDSLKNPSYYHSIREIGLSTHIVQDFYAHSNWVEIAKNSYTMAPIENLKDIISLLPNLQSGWHPVPPAPVESAVKCYRKPESVWDEFIFGGTHGCLEKDSNFSLRGATVADSPFGFGRTYHEIAGELAIEHTTRLLQFYYDRRHPHFMSCLVPSFRGFGCNQRAYRFMRANF
jgi:hypothetical protein